MTADIETDRQTNKQTNSHTVTLIAILRTPEVKMKSMNTRKYEKSSRSAKTSAVHMGGRVEQIFQAGTMLF